VTGRRRSFGFGIVGCGGAAAAVARVLDGARGAALVATLDRDPARAEALAAAHGATAHRTLPGLLADPLVDVVYVALPHDRLAPTAVAALDAGRHVLVEKPAATTAEGIRAMRAGAGRAECRVAVLFELRHVATVAAATRIVRSGALGPLRAIRIVTRIDKPPTYWASGPTGAVVDPWRASLSRAGGGVLLMNAIHHLDLVRAITALEPLRIAALTSAGVPDVEVEDAAVATIAWSDGVLGSLAAAAHAPGALDGETIEIDGDEGTLRLGDPYAARPTLDWFTRGRAQRADGGRWRTLKPRPIDPFRAAIAAFLDALEEGREPVPGLADADIALATVLAAYRSARTGRFEAVRTALAPGRSS
jgi:UDP-N-acetyl-2-amino-2-deoxyglucuronate dehydrogenase